MMDFAARFASGLTAAFCIVVLALVLPIVLAVISFNDLMTRLLKHKQH
jgi:uncharacterized RDD family membrane protein YckC